MELLIRDRQAKGQHSRRRFLLGGMLAFLFGPMIYRSQRSTGKGRSKHVYFLTREGKLVCVEKKKVPKTGKRVSSERVKNWVLRNNKKSS